MNVQLPTDDELHELDNELASEGVAIKKRPDAALWKWVQKVGGFPLGLAETAQWFQAAFAALHPSVDFTLQPFAVTAVSARGISYELHPPVVFGSCAIDPIRLIKIQPAELERIYKTNPAAFWELYWQAIDAVDLFMSTLDFHPKEPEAAKMVSVGTDQLETSARQLVAGVEDASLSQAACLATELVVKGVLLERGCTPARLKALGHDLTKLVDELIQLLPSSNDAEFKAVAATMPKYVQVRYSPPPLTMAEGQDLYRRALFICAEALRRTRHDQIYAKAAADPQVPARVW